MNGKGILGGLRRQGGYSLIEVLIAVGLLATVLVAIISLFVLGGRYVKSGKELSKASSLGMDLMEDMRNMQFEHVIHVVNGGCASGDKTVRWRTHKGADTTIPYGVLDPATDWLGKNIPDSGWSWKSEISTEARADYEKVLTSWYNQTEMQLGGGLRGGTEVRVDGFKDIASGKDFKAGDTALCSAKYLRVRVRVDWIEGRRARDVVFETLKF